MTNVTLNISGAELGDLSRTLTALLSTRGAQVRNGQVLAGEQTIDVSPVRVDALRQ